MLNRLVLRRRVVCPPLLVCFVCSMLWMPFAGFAQSAEGRGPAIVLVIPPQKTAEVPESVASAVEQNLKGLLDIDSNMKMLYDGVRDPGPEYDIPDTTPKEPEVQVKPLQENPKVARALDSLATVRKMVDKRQYEGALSRLLNLNSTFGGLVGDMDSFSPVLEALELTAASFINGGFAEEGAGAMRNLLTVQPDYAGAGQSDRVKAAVDRNRERLAAGGDLIVQVKPDDAVVYVNGRLVGQGNQVVTGLKRGKHYVRVTGDTSFPDGGTVTVKPEGNPVTVRYELKSRLVTIAPPPPPPVKQGPKPLVWYARTGLYAEPAFENDIKAAAANVFADNVLFVFIARGDNKFHIGAFVGNGLNGGVVEVEKAVVETDLSNLYIELLGLETRIQKAVVDSSSMARIAAQPPIYRMVQAKPKPVPVVVVAPPPPPPPAPVAVEPAYQPYLAPYQQPAPAVDPGLPADFPMDLPSDFPMADTAPAAQPSYQQAASTTTVQEEDVVEEEPVYKKWWLWTIVGVVVAGAVGGGLAWHFLNSDSGASVGGTVGW